ncbi:MAG TPA: ribonuclease D [Tepidisphaeraceae bacterium]|jgi:ribonuclease D|nr:ribonuclease D [Tepidisphaeraceae bacterium]
MSNDPQRRRTFGRGAHRARNHESAHAAEPTIAGAAASHPLVPSGEPILIDNHADLARLLQTLRNAKVFAYDSEFIGELTYIPKLCLVQVCWADGVALIDPLAGDVDVTPFWELLTDPSVTKIVHAGQQDVEPVARLLKRPAAGIFDTQIAAGLAGLPYPVSLAKLVGELTGAKLGKSLTFSHWDQRPLSPMQLRYAADDVRYLLAVHDDLQKRLNALGHFDWAMAESDAMCQVNEFGFDPSTAFLRVRGGTNLPPRNLNVLRELTIWRDACARHHDLPPRAFLKDEILIDMARQPVKSTDKLDRVRGLPRPVEHEYGEQIVAVTLAALDAPETQLPRIADYEPLPSARFRAESFWAAAQSLATGRQIDPALLTSRQEIGDLHRRLEAGEDASEMRVMTGWRREALGGPLLDLYQGRRTFSARWVDGSLKIEAI